MHAWFGALVDVPGSTRCVQGGKCCWLLAARSMSTFNGNNLSRILQFSLTFESTINAMVVCSGQCRALFNVDCSSRSVAHLCKFTTLRSQRLIRPMRAQHAADEMLSTEIAIAEPDGQSSPSSRSSRRSQLGVLERLKCANIQVTAP